MLSGNPISDFSFLRFLPALEVLHCDSCGIESFDQLQLSFCPKLTHLIARNNLIKDLEGQSCDTVKVIDLSQNQFTYSAVESVSAAYPALQTFIFGTLGAAGGGNGPECGSNLNTIELFKRLMVDRFYAPEQISYCVQFTNKRAASRVGGLQFEVEVHPASASFSIKKLNRNEEIRNEKVIVSLFELTSGFQINQTFQEVVLLSDFLQSQRYTITTKRNLEILHYPTEQPN